MGPKRLILGSVILGLCWTNFITEVLTDSVERCTASPCECDRFGRLTCDCKDEGEELLLTTEGDQKLSRHSSRILITNCPSVVLSSSSLTSMTSLHAIEFKNIGNLTLYRHSFELSPKTHTKTHTKIYITNSSIDLLPSFTFKGDVNEISFQNVRISQINAYAFTDLVGTEKLMLKNCVIDNMKAHAFRKFDVGYLHVIGGSFGDDVPSRVMNDIEVQNNFMLDGVQMGTVRSSAFIIKRPQTIAIQNSVFGSVEGGAFNMTARGTVIIKDNTFESLNLGAFLEITIDPESRRDGLKDIIFKNNSLGTFEEGSVLFDRSSFRPELDNVLINQICDCLLLSVWKGNIMNYSNIYTRIYSKSEPQEPISEGPETFLCLDPDLNSKPVTFLDFHERYCVVASSTLFFVLILVGLLVVLLLGGFLVIWCCMRQRENNQKRWISVPTNAPDVVSKKNGVITREGPVDSRITMVVPDGRVYRETEFHVIVEKAEPLTTEL